HRDEHAPQDPVLRWVPSRTAVAHRVYLGTDRRAVAGATASSPEYKGEQRGTRFPTRGLTNLATYYWRVDEVHSGQAQGPTPGGHDIVIRYVRLRVGDESGKTLDGMGARGSDHVIFDHCSISWSIDEGFSSRQAKNITFQRCIIAEALNLSVHSHYVGTGKGHSFAASISGDVGSFHHNLLAHCAGRNWSLAGGLDNSGRLAGRLDIRNNVV